MTSYTRRFFRYGLTAVLILLVGAFVYGLFNRFSIWHGAAPAGIQSGLAYFVVVGIFVGPIVFLLASVAGVLLEWNRRGQASQRKRRFVLAAATGCYSSLFIFFLGYLATTNGNESIFHALYWHGMLLHKIFYVVGITSNLDQEKLDFIAMLLSVPLGIFIYGSIAYFVMSRRPISRGHK